MIAPVLVASPGPGLRIHRVGAVTLCDVAGTAPPLAKELRAAAVTAESSRVLPRTRRPTLTDCDESRTRGVTRNARRLTERDVSHRVDPWRVNG